MKTITTKLNVKSQKQFEIIDITAKVADVLHSSGVSSGTVSVFTPHSTASIRINHNEPLLLQDLMHMMYRLVPSDINYAHDTFEIKTGVAAAERSNGHAHVKAFLLGACQTIPIQNSKMLLGERQSIFFVELDGGRSRNAYVTVTGEET